MTNQLDKELDTEYQQMRAQVHQYHLDEYDERYNGIINEIKKKYNELTFTIDEDEREDLENHIQSLKYEAYHLLEEELGEYLVDGYEIFFIDDSKLNEYQRWLKHHPESNKRYFYLGKKVTHGRI